MIILSKIAITFVIVFVSSLFGLWVTVDADAPPRWVMGFFYGLMGPIVGFVLLLIVYVWLEGDSFLRFCN